MKKKTSNSDSRPRRFLIGITGGIAAYKIPLLIRMLKKEGHEVQVLLTDDAHHFVTPLTLSVLSENPVYSTFYKSDTGEWHNHVALANQADALLIAPATASTMSKMARGQCDNLLLATYMSTTGAVWVAPAMDHDMYEHPATQQNLKTLSSHGCRIIPPEEGLLASGISGKGRMAEPETLFRKLTSSQQKIKPLQGRKVLLSAGPTHEAIDPVRFIGNHSSGKMGYALAESLANKGAEVTLVSGPVTCRANHPAITIYPVTSASEMHATLSEHFPECDVLIMAAAVADYTPEETADKKIKKDQTKTPHIQLKPTTDILKSLSAKKKKGQTLVGFSLETDHGEENALKKLKAKDLDLIVLNTLEDEGAGFAGDTNKVTLFDRTGNKASYPLKSKADVAEDIIRHLLPLMNLQTSASGS